MDSMKTLSNTLPCETLLSDSDENNAVHVEFTSNGNMRVMPWVLHKQDGYWRAAKTVLHLEVCFKSNVVTPLLNVKATLQKHLASMPWCDFEHILQRLHKGFSTLIPFDDNEILQSSLEFIRVQDEFKQIHQSHLSEQSSGSTNNFALRTNMSINNLSGSERILKSETSPPTSLELVFHLFSFFSESPGVEELSVSGGEDQTASAAQIWMLPHVQLKSLWDSLFYEDDLKWRLVKYVETMLLFSDKKIDQNVVSYNRIVLLHGPPGTGKTSLCHALAQRLSIRLGSRFRYCQLVEINSHSLFSRWFSESGKLVMAMFDKIRELYSDPEALVFILIDEVESLAASRKAQGSEPSDAVRVVNAMLTQLDQLKTQPNVVVLTTSNLTEYLCELPASNEVLNASASSKRLLQLCKPAPRMKEEIITNTSETTPSKPDPEKGVSLYGLSGRTLRKLPFLTIANNLDVVKNVNSDRKVTMTMHEFLSAFERTLIMYRNQMESIEI
ncbi:pachytene checkpoint protein 2 homolog isoform X2 [Convolutriloba macropyga]|uniref:pachytene checkpoint protein 2 homolog isoform X2 n=1 Tax=Convolutriloba macropyga TaxID=536237 RepID=UPI003F522180